MIKTRINNEYKDIVGVFGGGTLQKEIIKIWSREAGTYVYESSVEYTGALPITINANGNALIDYRIYGADGGVGEQTENLIDADNPGTQRVELEPNTDYCLCKYIGTLQSGFPRCYVYDENDNRLFGDYLKSWVSYSFTNPSNGAYAIISFENAAKGKVSFTKGRAVNTSSLYPANYIPYGYKLPMTVSDGNTEQTVPVYIGENKLAENEYVDYAEGKIYRKNPANYFDGYFELGSINHNTGAEMPSSSSIRTDFIELEPSNRYYIKWATGSLYMLFVSYDESKNYLRYMGAKSTNPSYFDLNANEKYIRFYLYNTITPPKEMMICKNAAAPYYDPQDPPAPLPEIPTIDGTTVIDYDGDPKPSQMYVKYRR